MTCSTVFCSTRCAENSGKQCFCSFALLTVSKCPMTVPYLWGCRFCLVLNSNCSTTALWPRERDVPLSSNALYKCRFPSLSKHKICISHVGLSSQLLLAMLVASLVIETSSDTLVSPKILVLRIFEVHPSFFEFVLTMCTVMLL